MRVLPLLLALAAAGCVSAPRTAPPPAPPRVVTTPPAPAPVPVSADWLEWRPIQGPCNGDCGVAGYFGWYVEEGMSDVFISSPETPLTWTYAGDHLLAGAVTRRIATLWSHVDVEPEFGVGQRMGKQHETEIWGAVFFRWRGFPWDDRLITTVAISTGMNYATDISAFQPLVQALVTESAKFDGQVYLVNGDSHVYNSDQPLAAGSKWLTTYGVTGSANNLQRITVDGSSNNKDWLRFTITRPGAAQVLTWERVPYTS